MNDLFHTPKQILAAYENGLPGWQFHEDTMDVSTQSHDVPE